MPEEGDELTANEEFGAVESRKAASDLYSPVSGEVVEINEELVDNPKLINNNPLEAWIVKVKINDFAEVDNLMDPAAYAEFCEKNTKIWPSIVICHIPTATYAQCSTDAEQRTSKTSTAM